MSLNAQHVRRKTRFELPFNDYDYIKTFTTPYINPYILESKAHKKLGANKSILKFSNSY